MPILTPEERVGTLLAGRYRLESILGTGGTANVFRAVHSWTGRSIALKLLKPEHARDRGLVMRFLREARSASTIVHPNVVTILDMGTDPEGDVYLAMELVEGESLGALLDREGSLDAERAVTLLRPIMEALSLAHSHGIVHRDIKPDNVLIGDRGDGVVRPILLDFGMAKMTEAAWGHATQSGLIVGTPFYMSPEQAEGAPDVGAASDVWSMGVLLYRALSGVLPFFASSPTSLLLAIVRGDHVPLDVRAPALGPAIASVVERALRVDRAERYPDMSAMIAALEGALAGKIDRAADARTAVDTPAVPLRKSPELGARSARGKRIALFAAVAVLLVVVGIGGALFAPGLLTPSGDSASAPSIASPIATAPSTDTASGTARTAWPALEGAALEAAAIAAPALEGAALDTAGLGTSTAVTEPAGIATARGAVAGTLEPQHQVAPAATTDAVAAPAEPGVRPRGRGLARSFRGEDGDERARGGLATEW